MRRAGVFVLAVALTGCNGSGHSPTTTTTSTVASTTTTTSGGFSGGGTTEVRTPAAGRAFLTAVRVAGQPGFDRVVFEFEGDVPGYRVGYIDRAVQEDASGKEIAVAGDSVLRIHMEHASGADLSGGKVRQTYTGPKRVTATGTATVVEVVDAGDFEGVLTWVAGVKGHPAFKVSALTSPSRVVVDVAAG